MRSRTIEWHDGTVVTVDQLKLPHETVFLEMKTCNEIAEAIKTMKIRGAPLLGAAAAFALALTAHNSHAKDKQELVSELEKAAETLRATRPTAINLFWAINRILDKAKGFSGNARDLAAFVVGEAQKIADEDAEANHLIGKHGAELIRDGDVVLTHCNAGALATVEYGTALGVVRSAWEQGKKIRVFATETRPKLQGAKLTTYELKQDGIPATLITDNMVGYVMYKKLVNKVLVGADRIVKDAVINKIGTFTIAVLAKEHNIPFYVAAPTSTFDLAHESRNVVIEQRSSEEVACIGSQRIAAEGVEVLNPAFDITPLEYVTAIICETGILYRDDFRKFKTSIHT
ncbi:MAG TPA: S-methyl-5-thioribose-1-phosphate isomerase [Candidatus Bathyarchaeia archaeon]